MEIKIDTIVYKVVRILQDSNELREFELKDSKGNKFLFQLVLNKSPSLWKVNKKSIEEVNDEDFCLKNLVDVKKFKFL